MIPGSQRRMLFAPVLAIHAALIVWFTVDAATPPKPSRGEVLSTFDVAQATPPAPVTQRLPPVRPLAPLKLAWTKPTIDLPAIPIASLSDPVGMPNGSCDVTSIVQQALRDSPEARDAVAALPPEARSVANAVMLWDGSWIAGAAPRYGTVVRLTPAMCLNSSPARCAEVPVP